MRCLTAIAAISLREDLRRLTLAPNPYALFAPDLIRGFVVLAGVDVAPVVNLEAGLTRVEAAFLLNVSAHTVSMWALDGWEASNGRRRVLSVVGRRGRSRLYRYGDLVDAEADTRRHPNSRRGCRPTTADRDTPAYA